MIFYEEKLKLCDRDKRLKVVIKKIADNKIKIPMLGKTESLNASVATGVILYEYVRNKIK